MQDLEFGFRANVGMAIAALVIAIEGTTDFRRLAAIGDRNLDVMALSHVAHLGVALEQRIVRAELSR